jgi:hypothetical protein
MAGLRTLSSVDPRAAAGERQRTWAAVSDHGRILIDQHETRPRASKTRCRAPTPASLGRNRSLRLKMAHDGDSFSNGEPALLPVESGTDGCDTPQPDNPF